LTLIKEKYEVSRYRNKWMAHSIYDNDLEIRMDKTICAAALLALVCGGMPAAAQQTSATDRAPEKPAAANPAEFDKRMAQVQEDVNKMQEQMAKIRQTQDPQERQRLLQEHWATMQSAMAIMHETGGQGMMGGPGMMGWVGGPGGRGGMMGWGGMRDYYSKLTPEQLKQRQYMTDQRLRMQQLMMEQMSQQNYWMGQPPASAPK